MNTPEDILKIIEIYKHNHSFLTVVKKWFNNVEIKGGVSYFLKDNNHNGFCKFNDYDYNLSKYDIILTNPQAIPLIDKIIQNDNIISIYIYKKKFLQIKN